MRGWTTFEQVKDQELLELLCQSSLSRVSVEWFLECKTLPSISQHPAASCCEAVSLLPTGCKEVLDIGQWALGSQRKQPLCQTLQNTVKQCSFKAAIYHNYITIIEGSLEVKLPTIWTDGKAEVGRVREEKSRREKIREEKRKVRRKKMQVREKVGKSRNIVFFQWFVAPEGRKVGSLKRRVRSHLARWEMKSCTPLWREAGLQVKTYKTPQLRSTFGSWDVEKSCTPLWREAHLQVKTYKTPQLRSTFGSWDVEKSARRCGAKHICKWKNQKSDHFLTFRCRRSAWQAQGILRVAKSEQNVRVLCHFTISKNDGRRGTFAEDLARCISPGRRSARDMFIRDVRRSGRWCPERDCTLEHQIFSFGKMILRDRCSSSYDLVSLFRGRRNTLETWTGQSQNALARGRQPCTQLSIIEGSLAELLSFWCCQLRKIEEVSHNCFVFGFVKLKNWGSLAELFRFRRCQVQKLRKSRRIALFLMLSGPKTEEVKLADR